MSSVPLRAHATPFVLCLLVLPGVLWFAAEEARADSVAMMNAALPTAESLTSAVWTGTKAYVFGGWDAPNWTAVDRIVRYDPATDTTSTMGATLPTINRDSSAVWTGSYAYIFGGDDVIGHRQNAILRYDPATDTIQTMGATLPTGRLAMSAIWDGTNAYIFGGQDSGNACLTQIVRYDPATDTATVMNGVLPSPREATSAVWDGTNAYIFGGRADCGSSQLGEVVRYNPATDTVTTMSATIPAVEYPVAVWSGSSAFVLGGGDASGYKDQIVRYDPPTDTATVLSTTLPTPRGSASGVWAGTSVFYFGGDPSVAQILRFTPTPVAPPSCPSGPATACLLDLENVTAAPSEPLPPVDIPQALTVGTLHVQNNSAGTQVCVSFTPAGGSDQPITCASRSLLGTADPLVPRGDTPINVGGVPAGSLGSSPNLTVTVIASYAWDPAHLADVGSVAGYEAYLPFAPGDAAWFTTQGSSAALTVSVGVFENGTQQAWQSVSIPWLGQVLAAGQQTA